MKVLRILSLWGPVFLWAGLIFYFSSIPDGRTGGVSELPELMFRKMAHLFVYGVLAFFLARALAEKGWPAGKIVIVGLVVWCLVGAATFTAHTASVVRAK